MRSVSVGGVVVTLIAVGLCATSCGAGPDGAGGAAAGPGAAPASAELSYDPYARTLIEYLDARSLVDYAALKAAPGELDDFLARIAVVDPADYETWSDDDKIAFWINAYNALTLKAIVDHYPIESSFFRSILYPKNSIRQIPGVWTDLEFQVMGESHTLDGIEHDILRARFDEPRIHMALVCAAMSCPPLRWEPYVGERLDVQLQDQSVRFLSEPDNLRIDREAGRVELSEIFKWFGEDFVSMYGPDEGFEGHSEGERAVLSFIAEKLEGPDREYLESGDYSVKYVDYDWTLNEAPAEAEDS